jgi:photosystem II stability/assembly factor-like uncharacterized protein
MSRCSVVLCLVSLLLLSTPILPANGRQVTLPAPEVVPVGQNFLVFDNSNMDSIGGRQAIASDGSSFLLVWQQDREPNNNRCTAIYAARISPQGEVLDPLGIVVSTGNEEVGPPSVIFDGTRYLLVWAAQRSGVYEIYASRLSTEGEVLDQEGKVMTSGADPKPYRMIGLAYDGEQAMVTWRTDGDQIRAARLSTTEPQNLDNLEGFPVAGEGPGRYYPNISWDGENYLITWHAGSVFPTLDLKIYGARVTKGGQVLDEEGFPIHTSSGMSEHRSQAFDGQNTWVVWFERGQDYESTLNGQLLAARVSPSGEVLDDPPLLIADRARGQIGPQIACKTGSYCLVVYSLTYKSIGSNFRLSDVYGRRVTPNGQVLDPQAIPVSTSVGHQFGPVVGYNQDRHLVAWNDSTGSRNYSGALYAQILDESLSTAWQTLPGQVVSHRTERTQSKWIQEPAAQTTYSYSTNGLAFSDGSSYVARGDTWMAYENGDWVESYTIPQGAIFSSWGTDPNHIWLGGWCNVIYENKGSEWQTPGCLRNSSIIVTGLWGASGTYPWATTDTGKLFYYNADPPSPIPENQNWHILDSGLPYDLHDIWGAAADDIYAVGERGLILHYDGSAWTPIGATPTIQTLNAVWGAGPNDVFAVGDWGVILHYNGKTWRAQESGVTGHLWDVWGFDGQDVYAVGMDGIILHYDGKTWTKQESGVTFDLLTVWGAMEISGGLGIKTAWAAGEGLMILKNSTTFPMSRIFLPLVKARE